MARSATTPADRTVLAVTIAVLAAYNIVRSTVLPSGAHFATNTAMVGVVALLARWARLRAGELGLERATVGAGLRLGGAVAAAVLVVAVVAAAVSTDPFGLAKGYLHAPARTVLFQVLVEIPIATVLFEELAFRGVLHALLERMVAPQRALVVGALLFGCWHIAPAWHSAVSNGVGGASHPSGVTVAAAVVGTVIGTFIAGVVFVLMKRRSASLVAPMVAHWATNALTLLVVWGMAR